MGFRDNATIEVQNSGPTLFEDEQARIGRDTRKRLGFLPESL